MLSGKTARKYLFTVLQLAVCLQSVAGVDQGLAELMERLAGVTASRVNYKEVKNVDMVDGQLISTGTLSYISPDTLVRDVQKPQVERYEIRGNQVTIIRGEESESFSLETNPLIRAFIESFRATLAGDIKQLQDYYFVKLAGSVGAWQLQLVPRDKQMGRIIERIVMKGKEAAIEVIETYETNGDWSRMELTPIDLQDDAN